MKIASSPGWLIIACILLSLNIFAQDNHYAWNQFGSHNSILNNASLSRFEDESAVIINPATLSLATQSSFNFNANALGYIKSRFTNDDGDGFTIKTTTIAFLPSTVSGVIKPKNEDNKWVLGYSLYTSNKDKLDFSYSVEEKLNIINDQESPGDETYRSQANIISAMEEVSFVAGIGWSIGPHATLGVSQLFTYRLQDYTEVLSASASADPEINSEFDLTSLNYTYIVRYDRIMTQTKIGFTYKIKDLNIGMVLSSPTLGLFGNGGIVADLSLSNYRFDDDLSVPRKNYIGNGDYRKLKSYYKYPMNAALGVSRAFGKVRFYGSLFWYGKLNTYNILDPGNQPFIQPPNEQSNSETSRLLHVWGKSRNVYNGSIAADWIIEDNYHLFFSVRTDLHYADINPDEGGSDLVFKEWDYYHFTVGSQRKFGPSDWVVGLRYTYGKRDDYPQPISLNDPTNDDYLNRYSSTGKVISNGLQLLLSYTFTFGDFGIE